MSGSSPKKVADQFVAMGYELPFSVARLREQAVQRFKDDMQDAGLNDAGIPDQYIATPSLLNSPLSIKTLLASWTPPEIEKWTEQRIANTSKDAYESQGVSHNSKYWYFSQKNEIFARTLPINSDGTIDRTEAWGNVSAVHRTDLPETPGAIPYDHFGSPCYFGGRLYVPIESAGKKRPVFIANYSPNLDSHTLSALVYRNPFTEQIEPQEQSGWVAINPLDRCIYTSMECKNILGLGNSKNHVILVYSLDETVPLYEMAGVSSDLGWLADAKKLGVVAHVFLGFFPVASFIHYEDRPWALKEEDAYRKPEFPLDGVAGGVFDSNGRLFLSIGEDLDTDGDWSTTNRVCCYSAFDGTPLGSRVAGTDCTGDCEAEGLTIWNGEIFVVILHNDWPKDDHMNFHVYSPPGWPKWTHH